MALNLQHICVSDIALELGQNERKSLLFHGVSGNCVARFSGFTFCAYER